MSTSTNPLIARATALASFAHEGQQRDDSGGPYFRHPARVAATLARHFPDDPGLVAAASRALAEVLRGTHPLLEADLTAAIGNTLRIAADS